MFREFVIVVGMTSVSELP